MIDPVLYDHFHLNLRNFWEYIQTEGTHLTRILAVELAPRNITVNAIAPGYFYSKMTSMTGVTIAFFFAVTGAKS